jgi:hypothetical protein
MNIHPTTPVRSSIFALVLFVIGTPSNAMASEGPLTETCNENQGQQATSFGAASSANLTGIPLLPGNTVPTNGTNLSESPGLAGPLEFKLKGKFTFDDNGSSVQGSYREENRTGPDRYCKQQFAMTLSKGCVSEVRVHKYVHPLDIVADFRDDLPGQIAPDTASRSVDGTVFKFHLSRPVCAGETTRWLVLNTSIKDLTLMNGLEFIAPSGDHSKLHPIHVPVVAQ